VTGASVSPDVSARGSGAPVGVGGRRRGGAASAIETAFQKKSLPQKKSSKRVEPTAPIAVLPSTVFPRTVA